MLQNRNNSKEGASTEIGNKSQGKFIAYMLVGGFLIAIAWYLPKLLLPIIERPTLILISIAILYALIVVVLQQSLANIHLRREWRFRLAFLISAGLASLQVLLYSYYGNFGLTPTGSGRNWFFSLMAIFAAIFVTTFGAFLGALISTAMKDGLIEVNTPPVALTTGVYQKHLVIIGVPAAEPRAKRWFDVSLAVIGLIVSAPVWWAAIFLIWLEDPGPVLFVKNSTGKGGENFRLLKFRTMAREMEKSMALVQTQEVETRTLSVGRVLRKTALDELPQLINILGGEMSFVGPRPHRTPLVALYLEKMPEFAERHLVLPGLAGLAQVSGDFYMTPRQKLRFDRLYIQHRTLGFDIKLMFLAFLITFWYRWQKGWNGRLPRKYLHSRT